MVVSFVFLALVFFSILVMVNREVLAEAGIRVFDRMVDVPAAKTAVVLGTAPRLGNGKVNSFYRLRLDAATRLFQVGKVQNLLVSGDNSRREYDEPTFVFGTNPTYLGPKITIGKDPAN